MSSLLFGNGTDLVHWKPSPHTRGTFDILSTCIITMLLCVWTAVHLNVPPPKSVWGPRLRKVGWLILALLAPEMVAYTAWYQRQQALSVMRTVNEAFVLPDPPSWHERTIKGVKKAVTGFKRVFMPREQEPVRLPTLEAQRYPLPEDRHPWTQRSLEQKPHLLRYPYAEFDLIISHLDDESFEDSDPGQDNDNYKIHSEQETRHYRDNEIGSTTLMPGQVLHETGFKARNFREILATMKSRSEIRSEMLQSFDSFNGSHAPLPNISLTSQDVTRWKMASRADEVYKQGQAYSIPIFLSFVQRCKDWPDVDHIFDEPSIAFGFSAAALIYGGLHALAWFAHFGSSREQLLWRISACVVMGGVPIIFVLWKFFVWLDDKPVFSQAGVLSLQFLILPLTRLVLLLTGLTFLAYILARVYLVVECFINLSHLPAEVYDVPTWSTYFPHIS